MSSGRDRLTAAISAIEFASAARHAERAELISTLSVTGQKSCVEVCAWDGYLSQAIVASFQTVTLLESNAPFARHLASRFPSAQISCGPYNRFPLSNSSVDRVASLVGLHHVDSDAVLREARRVLRPGGRIAIAEVQAGSKVAVFLDGQVGSMRTQGHQGIYRRAGGWAIAMSAAGFRHCGEKVVDVPWRFESMPQAINFCRLTFGLEADDARIADAIMRLDPDIGDSVSWSWPLVYAWGE